MIHGTAEPFVELRGVPYSREQCFAAYTKAENGELLTKEEANLAGAWCVHPLNGNIGIAPFAIGILLLRQQSALRAVAPPQEPPSCPKCGGLHTLSRVYGYSHLWTCSQCRNDSSDSQVGAVVAPRAAKEKP